MPDASRPASAASAGHEQARPTVAIPVLNGGALLERTLRALASQSIAHELLVCDSGSSDGSAELAARHGARVIEIAPSQFGHGRTRNLLMREASGAHVAFLTQDAEPAHPLWLERLLAGFALAEDVAVTFGPYLPRAGASLPVRLELAGWFGSLSPDGAPRLDRLAPDERALAPQALMGARGFLTDANACLARSIWERVPFREIPYAEDRALAIDVLRAGWAKAYLPEAAVIHSHDYSPAQQLRRSFDEWRGLREVYGWREPLSPRHVIGQLRGGLGEANRELVRTGTPPASRASALARSGAQRAARLAGAILGSRADRLPARAQRALSLERRSGLAPLDLRAPAAGTDGARTQ
ncbi:MAG: glycosyl transferase group 2 family protein [Solirubrobacterales bacterium]|nr:glycosyl transferase group 2 family protein [Solirubrobacterales bacterium]